jgi:hypothetical protein
MDADAFPARRAIKLATNRTRSQRCEHSLPRGRALSTIDDSLGLRATLALDCAPPERAKVNSASEDAHTL